MIWTEILSFIWIVKACRYLVFFFRRNCTKRKIWNVRSGISLAFFKRIREMVRVQQDRNISLEAVWSPTFRMKTEVCHLVVDGARLGFQAPRWVTSCALVSHSALKKKNMQKKKTHLLVLVMMSWNYGWTRNTVSMGTSYTHIHTHTYTHTHTHTHTHTNKHKRRKTYTRFNSCGCFLSTVHVQKRTSKRDRKEKSAEWDGSLEITTNMTCFAFVCDKIYTRLCMSFNMHSAFI